MRKIIISLMIITIIITNISLASALEDKLEIKYYGIETCSNCKETEKLFKKLEKNYTNILNIQHNDVANPEAEKEFLLITSENGLPTIVPTIVVDGRIIQGSDVIEKELEPIIKKFIEDGKSNDDIIVGDKNINEIYEGKFRKLSVLVIIAASLLDGINPCAIAMLLFFMTLLLTLEDKKKALMAGISYCLAIFITYFLIGLGLLKALVYFSGLNYILYGIYGITIIICVYLIITDAKDYIALRRGKIEDVKNQLPKGIKHKIHNLLRKQASSKYIVITTFVTGVFVAILEFSCTGQVYIPTLSFILSQGNIKALAYLLLYNVGFILPTLLVTIIVYRTNEVLKVSNLLVDKRKHIKFISVIFYTLILIYFINKIIGMI